MSQPEQKFAMAVIPFRLVLSPDRLGPGIHAVKVFAPGNYFIGSWNMRDGFLPSVPDWIRPFVDKACKELASGAVRPEVSES